MNSTDHTPDAPDAPDPRLNPVDAEALDALVDAGFDTSKVSSACRDRACKACDLLGLTGSSLPMSVPRSTGVSLVDRVMNAIGATKNTDSRPPAEFTLHKNDAAALADLADAGYDVAQVVPRHRERAAVHARLMNLVTDSSSAPLASPALADRTVRLVALAADAESRTFKLDAPSARTAIRRGRFWDAVGVAAMLLLAVSVLWPIMDSVHQGQQRSACQTNLGSVASAMGNYAGEHRDALPVAYGSYGGSWWDVGTPQRSNSANLYTLARTGFLKLRDLACPGNLHARTEPDSDSAMDWRSLDEISYSYQVMFGRHRPVWRSPERTAILADRSPVILRAIRHETVNPLENSPNHCRCGQDVLFADGSTRWHRTPEVPTVPGDTARGRVDNIWLPWTVEDVLRQASEGGEIRLEGREEPGSVQDAFLAP